MSSPYRIIRRSRIKGGKQHLVLKLVEYLEKYVREGKLSDEELKDFLYKALVLRKTAPNLFDKLFTYPLFVKIWLSVLVRYLYVLSQEGKKYVPDFFVEKVEYNERGVRVVISMNELYHYVYEALILGSYLLLTGVRPFQFSLETAALSSILMGAMKSRIEKAYQALEQGDVEKAKRYLRRVRNLMDNHFFDLPTSIEVLDEYIAEKLRDLSDKLGNYELSYFYRSEIKPILSMILFFNIALDKDVGIIYRVRTARHFHNLYKKLLSTEDILRKL